MQPGEAQAIWSGRRAPWTIAGLLIAALVAFGLYAAFANIGSSAAGGDETSPAQVEPIGNTGLSRLTLDAQAVKRLGIETAPVRAATGGWELVPYSAVEYDADGASWAYVNTKPRTYVRQPLAVDRISGNTAIVSAGPPVGTPVVTVGAAELFGTEFEFDEE